jgi:hypothetical protein
MDDHMWYNMWSKRFWPFKEVVENDQLYWYDTTVQRVCWKTRLTRVERFSYSSKAEAAAILSNLSDRFDASEAYFKSATENGYLLVYWTRPLGKESIPKPPDYKFPQLGWQKVVGLRDNWWRTPDEADDTNDLDEILKSSASGVKLSDFTSKLKGVAPERVRGLVERTIRKDGKIVRGLKEFHNYRCQFPACEAEVRKRDGSLYVEVAHILPVSQGGESVLGNLIVLCPNHHKEFDYGDLEIDSQTDAQIKGRLNSQDFNISLERI